MVKIEPFFQKVFWFFGKMQEFREKSAICHCFDTHGKGKTDPVIFTAQTHPYQQRLGTVTNNVIYANTESSPVFYNPYPEILYNFQYRVIF